MDLTSSTTTTYTIGTDTPTPPPAQPTKTNTSSSKSLSFTNGTHNKHHHHKPTTTPPPSQPPPHSMVVYSYKECLKNHAASIGGHALDGCGEFMPSSTTNPADPRSLKCAACGCHRNFHRRDPQEPPHSNNQNNPTFLTCFYSTTPSSVTPTAPPPQPPPPPPLPHRGMSQSTSPSLSSSPSHSPSPMSSSPSSPPPLSHLPPSSYHHHTSSAPHMLLALGTNAYSVDHEHHHHQRNFNSSSVVMMKSTENNNNNNNNSSSGKKRYRTKFSQEQKEKMYSFSEKLGWRMQKGDDGLVQEFCNDIGVPRGVFKVWMHNNKNTLRNKRSEVVGNDAPQTDEKIIEDGNDSTRGDDVAFGSDINNPFSNTNGSNNDNVHVSINGLSSS